MIECDATENIENIELGTCQVESRRQKQDVSRENCDRHINSFWYYHSALIQFLAVLKGGVRSILEINQFEYKTAEIDNLFQEVLFYKPIINLKFSPCR